MAKTTKAKSTATVKKVVKKPSAAAKRVTVKKKSVAAKQPFMEARVTDQTLYWLIFGAAAIIFALWLFSLDAKVRDLYDQIDANVLSSETVLPIQSDQSDAQ